MLNIYGLDSFQPQSEEEDNDLFYDLERSIEDGLRWNEEEATENTQMRDRIPESRLQEGRVHTGNIKESELTEPIRCSG